MDRLSALDATFIYLETPQTPMNIGSVTIFAPANIPADAIFQSFRDHTIARLDLLPSYRRRLQMTPLGIDHPVWVIEHDLDLEYHIRRRALPHPGSMAQLRDLIGELHMIPLDRSRPLWQYYVIEGLEGGGFAVYVKVHHSAMDGVSGTTTLPAVFDFTPEPGPVPPPKPPGRAEKPSFSRLLGGAAYAFVRQDFRLIRSGPAFAAALAAVGRRAASTFRLLPDGARLAPKTPLNVSISKERSYGMASVSLADVKSIAKARQATVNDVVLTICSGALRRYLGARQALPKQTLVAAVPMSVREQNHAELNNQVAAVLCRLATDVADPVQRLAVIASSTRDSKDRFFDMKNIWSTDVSVFGAPLVITALGQIMVRTRLLDLLPTVMNLWISSVPGPQRPMYCAGVRALHYFPVSIPYQNFALNITAQSYLDSIDFGLTACSRTVPDVQVIADTIVEELATLKRASDEISNLGKIEVIEIARLPNEAAPPSKVERSEPEENAAPHRSASVVTAALR